MRILQVLFLTVLEISLASSVIIAVLLVLSPMLGKRYKSKLSYLLWLVLAVRLLTPLNVPWEHAFRLNLFAAQVGGDAATAGQFIPNMDTVRMGENNVNTQEIVHLNKTDVKNRVPIKPAQVMAIVWVSGTSLFLLYHMSAYLYACRRLKRWCVPVESTEVKDAFARVKRDMSTNANIGLYFSTKAASPLLVGFLHPRIILPERSLTREQLEFVLRHELGHYRRHDLWYKLLILLANAAHWFNPLVYIMNTKANLEAELACDADVLEGSDSITRMAYGYAILSVIEQGWRSRTPLTTRFYGGKKQMLERFNDIADGKNKKRGFAILLIISALITFSGCMVKASAQAEQSMVAQPVPDLEVADIPPETVTPARDQNMSKVPEAEASEDITANDIYMGEKMIWPLPDYYSVSSSFGPRFGGEDYHTGMDITGQNIYGKPVIAANAGTVIVSNREYTPGVGYGMYIVLDHGDGAATLYGQLSDILVNTGDVVERGQEIGAVGSTGFSTGPHLHFEVRQNGRTVDPTPYISSPGFVWPTTGGFVPTGVNGYPGHTGMDIMILSKRGDPTGTSSIGTPVFAAAEGTVIKAVDSNVGYGKYIVIDHGNGYQTLYAHNYKLAVSVGDSVVQGQKIAEMGRSGNVTGVHLHFEVRYNGRIMNAQNYVSNPDDTHFDSSEPAAE